MEGVKMKVTRTLHPIGQGAFYTEKFEYDGQQCNVVFDCGGTEKFIKKEVDEYCTRLSREQKVKKPAIDAVFISHFHNDHVNGLETLLNKAEVKCIFLPLLNDDEVYALSLSFVEKLGDPLYSGLIESAIRGTPLRGHINVVRIDKYNGGISDEQPYFLYDGQNEHTDSRIEIPSGTSIKLKNSTPWIFKTFNFGNATKEKMEKLVETLKENGFESSLEELIKECKDKNKRKKIRDCYKKVLGKKKLNANSMVTYSGTEKGTIKVFHNNSWLSRPFGWKNLCCHKVWNDNLAGCMYFGDYEAKEIDQWEQYEKSFGYLINLLHVQQVPHHGAASNYNVLLNKPPKLNFISAGISNMYEHPSLWTLYELNSYRVPWIWISEDSERVVFEYEVSKS